VAVNVEIKASIPSVDALLPKAAALADGAVQVLDQDDTFFRVASGRLKLRQFGDRSAELIHYHRPDTAAAKVSDYLRVPVSDPDGLRAVLHRGCGTLGRVHKRRWLLLAGQTRIHLDRVQDLGDFMELEVVLRPDQSPAQGRDLAERLMLELGLGAAPRVAGAYLDLLAARA
jgi:adenylate cyclase class IV